MSHFANWGMEIHAGILNSDPMIASGLLDPLALEPVKDSKTEVLFCSKPWHMYSDPSTFDGTDLSPIITPHNGFLPVVDKFPYLGDMIARDGSDDCAVDAHIESGCRAFGGILPGSWARRGPYPWCWAASQTTVTDRGFGKGHGVHRVLRGLARTCLDFGAGAG